MVRPQKISDAQIVGAAREALVEHGPGVAVARIAEKLDVSATAILKRMGSREELIARALCPEGPPTWLLRLDTPVSEAELPEALVEILVEALDFFTRLVPLLILIRTANVDLSAIVNQPQPPGERVRGAFTEWIDGSRGRPRRADPEPAAFVEAMLGAVESRCFHAYLEGEAIGRRQAKAWVRQLVAGLWPRLAASLHVEPGRQ